MVVDDVPVVRLGELTDEAWAVIAPLLAEPGGDGNEVYESRLSSVPIACRIASRLAWGAWKLA
ncbi:hypothetical protein ACLQ29_29375 [Micromonospora sp. DT228]|uniref:hypothetical protein n=1 Tax=Micromonospora sp. DT228 TaxID=3393443 RepID=UPI003CE7178A